MPISFPIVVLSSAGLVASGYIWYKQVTSGPVSCIGSGCAAVIRSRYGRLLGFPNGVWGVVYFGGVLVAAGLGGPLPAWNVPTALASLVASMVALILHAYLTYLQIFVLRALCSWCLTSAALTLAILLLLIQGLVIQFLLRTA